MSRALIRRLTKLVKKPYFSTNVNPDIKDDVNEYKPHYDPIQESFRFDGYPPLDSLLTGECIPEETSATRWLKKYDNYKRKQELLLLRNKLWYYCPKRKLSSETKKETKDKKDDDYINKDPKVVKQRKEQLKWRNSRAYYPHVYLECGLYKMNYTARNYSNIALELPRLQVPITPSILPPLDIEGDIQPSIFQLWLQSRPHVREATMVCDNRKTKLTIVSDLHLERYNTPFIDPLVPLYKRNKYDIDTRILALVGDICSPFHRNFEPFMKLVASHFNYVLFIPGNHEYYNLPNTPLRNIGECSVEILHKLRMYQNIVLLNNRGIIINGYHFLGSTLWSKITNHKNFISKRGDYRHILNYQGKKLTIDETNQWHDDAVVWLKEELKQTNLQTIVLTHFAPLMNTKETPVAHEKYIGAKNVEAHCTNLSSMVKSPINIWGFGHTHNNSAFYHNKVLMYSNPLGYYNAQLDVEEGKDFDASHSFNLDNLYPLVY
jgi:hypothetical protein